MNTKKYIFWGFCILFSVVTLASCETYLDKTPESKISPDQAFKNWANFQGFVEELYGCIPTFTNAYWTNSWNWGDDEVSSADMTYHIVTSFDNGDFWAWQSEHNGWNTSWMDKASDQPGGDRMHRDLWGLGWYAIRKADVGLANMDKFQGTQEEKNLLKGQMLFFRGWFYFQFMQYFGGMPYLTKPLPVGSQFKQKRLSYQATADSAAKDLQEAADLLPINWDNTAPGKLTAGHNRLRINKIMALGYLGKDLLWAASPLMNGGSNSSVASYNKEYAQKAAKVFGQLLSLVESGQTQYKLVPFSEWHSLFYTEGQNWELPGSTGAIFISQYQKGDNSNFGTTQQYMPTIIGDASNFFPTANYVDYYGMANGLPITDPNSGYDPQHPWKNRDPRFYQTFIFDGEQVVQGTMPADQEQNRHANLYTGGSYRYNNGENVGGSNTGYVLRKFIPLTANKYDNAFSFGNNLHTVVPWMRLGGIYIMYAEAAAAGYGSPTGKAPDYSKTAVEALNVIRDRAGVGHVAPQYLDNVDDFMGVVRRAWAQELGYEKHRFTNLRRWLLLTNPKYLTKTKVEFDRAPGFDPDHPRQNKVLNFHEVPLKVRHYTQRDYWLPLKRSDVTISKFFKQNPGW